MLLRLNKAAICYLWHLHKRQMCYFCSRRFTHPSDFLSFYHSGSMSIFLSLLLPFDICLINLGFLRLWGTFREMCLSYWWFTSNGSSSQGDTCVTLWLRTLVDYCYCYITHSPDFWRGHNCSFFSSSTKLNPSQTKPQVTCIPLAWACSCWLLGLYLLSSTHNP